MKGAVFSPEQGIVCDKKSGFCADSEGISLGYTGEYLGEKAMQTWDERIAKYDDFDMTRFVLSNGVDCNTRKKVCHTNKFDEVVDKKHTKALFGK